MITTSPLLSEVQNQSFAYSAQALINGKDLSYKGFDLEVSAQDGSAFSLEGTEAIKNKVMLWMVSSYGDYVREPYKGGPLHNLIGRTMTDENAIEIIASISSAFQSFFANDLVLINVDATPDKVNRRWKIRVLVRDPIRRELFDIAVGVTA